MNGFLSALKPTGMTSSDVVLKVRRRLPRGTKIGHAGTLDPGAAGVLPLMIGKATRLFDLITDKEKTYLAQWIPGLQTDTQDLSGTPLQKREIRVKREELEAVIPRFIGDIGQVPPMYSALKRDGKRLYDLAREGQQIGLEPRRIHVDSIEVLEEAEDGSWMLRIHCGRGTYIRTLCQDIGTAMGVPACMGALTRTAAGRFTIGEAVPLEDLLQMQYLEPALLPMDYPLAHLPKIVLKSETEKQVRCGNPIDAGKAEFDCGEGVTARLYLEERFCGIGHLSEGRICFDAMLLE